MDILNWLRIKKQNLIRTTIDSPKDLVVLGADVSFQKRGDKYQSYAMPAEDFLATAARPYKVYTALLTQSGGDSPFTVYGDESFVLGYTYTITANPNNYDLTIYGAPNNNVGTSFVSTGYYNLPYDSSLTFSGNYGAPVVTVLENTIGNIWFSYNNVGDYNINSNELFIENKTSCFIAPTAYSSDYVSGIYTYINDISLIKVYTNNYDTPTNGVISNTSIEIRVYN